MQRLDLIPVGLLVALAGTVGAMAVRSAGQGTLSETPALVASDPADALDDSAGAASPTVQASLALSARGGHVRSEMRRSALEAPDFDRDDVLRRLSFGASGTYILAMLETDSGLARWPERPMEPIRIWVEPASALPDWRPEYVDSARRAFEQWQRAGIPVRVSFLVDSAGAEVRVLWVDRLTESRIGSTRRVRDQHWWIVAGDITIALHSAKGEPLGAALVGATALHEAGHLLGLNHSPDPADLMAMRHHGVHQPSAADLATLRLLYSVPPGRLR